MRHIRQYTVGIVIGIFACLIIAPNVREKQLEDYVIVESVVPGEQRSVRVIGNGTPIGFGPQPITIEVPGIRSRLTAFVWNDGGLIPTPNIWWDGKIAHLIVSGCEQKDVEYIIDCSSISSANITVHDPN